MSDSGFQIPASLVMDGEAWGNLALVLLKSPAFPRELRRWLVEDDELRRILADSLSKDVWIRSSKMARQLDVAPSTLHGLLDQRHDPSSGLVAGVHYLNPTSKLLLVHSLHFPAWLAARS